MNQANSQQALTQLQNTQKTAQDPNTILSQQKQQLGVNAAQDTLTGLRGAINNTTKLLNQVAPSVMGRTGNSLVTQAQAGRIIQNEQAPISQNLTQENTQYNQGTQDLSTLEQRAQEAASGIYQGQQNKLSYMQNLYNTLFQREQTAQAAKQAAADRAEKIREFNASLAASRSAAASGGIDIGSLLGGGSSAPKTPAPLSQQQKAYNEVRSRGPDKSDYAATLKSANYGNAYDKLKVQLYRQLFPNVFGAQAIGNTIIQGTF